MYNMIVTLYFLVGFQAISSIALTIVMTIYFCKLYKIIGKANVKSN